ncbi:hypothetical protein EPUL_006489, partial [Erysiphe pulchra]
MDNLRRGPRPKKLHSLDGEEIQIIEESAKKEVETITGLVPTRISWSKRQTELLTKTKHRIDNGNSNPIKLPPRRYSPIQQQAIQEFCKTHDGKIIRKSHSPWAAPLLLTPKNQTTIRTISSG